MSKLSHMISNFLFLLAMFACSVNAMQVQALAPKAAGCTFKQSAFTGKICAVAYAGDGKLIVRADRLYLYDTTKGSVLGTADVPLDSFYVQRFDGSYLLAGFGKEGPAAYLYNSKLVLQKEINPSKILKDDFVVSETGMAISPDGKLLAIATMRGLYLYNLETGKLTTLLDYSKNASASKIRVMMINGMAFSGDGKRISFCGDGVSVPAVSDENSFSIYGSVAISDGKLKLTKPSSYNIDELQSGGGRLFFPQTFTKSSGKLLWLDEKGQEKTLAFATSGEGKNGVYISEQGKYVATAVLNGKLTVRVYEADSGKLVSTKTITNPDARYFGRVPRIVILDDAKTALALLGAGIGEVPTLAVSWKFGR